MAVENYNRYRRLEEEKENSRIHEVKYKMRRERKEMKARKYNNERGAGENIFFDKQRIDKDVNCRVIVIKKNVPLKKIRNLISFGATYAQSYGGIFTNDVIS